MAPAKANKLATRNCPATGCDWTVTKITIRDARQALEDHLVKAHGKGKN